MKNIDIVLSLSSKLGLIKLRLKSIKPSIENLDFNINININLLC